MKRSKTESPRYVVPLRRERESRTNYRTRLKLLQGHTTRLVVRKSLHGLSVQLVDYAPTGDLVRATVAGGELRKLGWKGGANVPFAYLCGLLIAQKAKHAKIEKVILDLGTSSTVKGSQLYAVAKGAVDAGLHLPVSKEILPDAKRVNGEHIAAYAKALGDKAKKMFGGYSAKGLSATDLPKHVQDIKKKIQGS